MWERHYNRHVKSVMKSGKPARAKVLAAEVCGGSGISTGDVSWGWNMDLQIVPEDAPSFDLQVRMEIPMLMTPLPGMELQVVYDPEKPEKIIVDPASFPTDPKGAEIAQAIATVRARGGDTTGMQEAGEAAGTPVEAAAAAMAAARRNLMAQYSAQATQIDQVRATEGEEAASALMAERSKAAIAQVLGARAQLGLEPVMPRPPDAPPAAAPDAAIEAKLTQLKQLNAAGVLDDETYQASKQRLLDSL